MDRVASHTAHALVAGSFWNVQRGHFQPSGLEAAAAELAPLSTNLGFCGCSAADDAGAEKAG